jgi:hypothetical protein
MKALSITLAVAALFVFTQCASKSKDECETCPIKRAFTGGSKPAVEKKGN